MTAAVIAAVAVAAVITASGALGSRTHRVDPAEAQRTSLDLREVKRQIVALDQRLSLTQAQQMQILQPVAQ